MTMNDAINPVDLQKILQMSQRLITNYRDGQAGRAFFDQVGDLSLEWEQQGLPCAIPQHGRRDRFETFKWPNGETHASVLTRLTRQ
jgi:hypothetical protein